MKIGVVILNYNSAKDTAKCVEFLQKQKFDKEYGVGCREPEFKVSCEQTPLRASPRPPKTRGQYSYHCGG